MRRPRLALVSHATLDTLAIAIVDLRRALCGGRKTRTARFRLIGVGADTLVGSGGADPPTLFDRELGRSKRIEQAMDQIPNRLGEGSVRLDRGST